MQILKGRIIAVVFFVLYQLAGNYVPTLGIVLGLALFILAPWIIMKSLAFNARYSQYRNIRFGFHQDLKESATVFVLIPFLAFLPIIIVVGLLFSTKALGPYSIAVLPYLVPVVFLITFLAIYPYLVYRTKRYIADNHRYGNADFNLRLDGAKPFYNIYLKVGLILATVAICFFILAKALGITDIMNSLPNAEISGLQTSQRYIQNVDLKNTELENLDLENLDLDNLDLEQLGLEDLDLENFDLQNVDPSNSGNPDTDIQPLPIPPELGVGLFIMQILSMLIYLFIFAYIAAHTYNLIYQNTDVGKHRLRANMKPGGLAMIYFTNTLGIIFTLGLFIPWAKVRTARYRADHTALQVNGDLDNFIARQDKHQAAFGEEFGEVFDLDVGI